MHNTFLKLGKSDFNSAAEGAVTDHNIKDFLENTRGIKNERKLKSVLQSALSSGIEVNIASFTRYPNAVKRVVENHLGLSKEQADSVSVFSRFPQDYDTQLQGLVEEQKSEVGKNLHICKAIVEYKGKHGQLPKTVMLVDDDTTNVKKIKNFVKLMSTREEWLKENRLSIEDIQKIKFEGVEVLEDKNVGYLERVQEFIDANLVQEPIYENLKKEEPIYQNLQDIQKQLSEEKPPQLPPKKSKLNKVHTDREQDYRVSSAKGTSEVTIKGSNQIDDEKIITDSLTQIKDFSSNYKGEDRQPRQEISELLNVNLQKMDINLNYVTRNPSEKQQAAASPRRYIKATQDKNTGSNTSERDKREKGKKTDLGSKILSYIQGAEKVLDAGYDALSAVGGKMLNVGKTAFSKIKETQELSKRDIEVSDPNHSSKFHVTLEGEPKAESQVEAELKRRANAASQEQSVGR